MGRKLTDEQHTASIKSAKSKTETQRRLTSYVAFMWITGAFTFLVFGYVAAPAFNISPSVPTGLYLQIKLAAARQHLHRGEFVMFCPTAKVEAALLALPQGLTTDRIHGKCPDGRIPFIKEVAALPGDEVEVKIGSTGYVAINGVHWKNSKLTLGTTYAHHIGISHSYKTRVKPNEIWALGVIAQSVDSRYFGAIPQSALSGIAIPIATRTLK